jgi:predicted amidohydrolase
MKCRHRLFDICLFFFLFVTLLPTAAEIPFRIAGVQLKVNTDLYRSEELFRARAAAIIRKVLAENSADLIVFPEYTGVFFSFFGMPLDELGIGTVEEGLAYLRRTGGYSSLNSFFMNNSSETSMNRIWGSLAREFRVAILGGSAFVPIPGSGAGALVNRAFLYGEDGRLLYVQDKVYPTPFEAGVLGIVPGQISAAETFQLEGRTLALTLCRDTFFRAWEPKFSDADLWIDIKANGEVYGEEERVLFRRALPERLAGSGVDLGMTVCLNGSFLDLFWEGPSSVVRADDTGGISYIDRAESPRQSDIVRLELW